MPGYHLSFSQMTFNMTPCVSQSQFECMGNVFIDFFMNDAAKNCSHECPFECERLLYRVSAFSTDFPASDYSAVLVTSNDMLARKTLNMDSNQVLAAYLSGQLSLNQIQKALDKKILSVNVCYDDLIYTSISQEPKYTISVGFHLFTLFFV
jgi:hypothetical protein